MKTTFPTVVLALIITFLLGVSIATGLKTDAPLKVNESNYTQSIDKNSNSYILKDCNGYLGVYKPDGQSPVMVFDTDISLLPEYDRDELSKGVYAKDYKELTRLIEDYIS